MMLCFCLFNIYLFFFFFLGASILEYPPSFMVVHPDRTGKAPGERGGPSMEPPPLPPSLPTREGREGGETCSPGKKEKKQGKKEKGKKKRNFTQKS